MHTLTQMCTLTLRLESAYYGYRDYHDAPISPNENVQGLGNTRYVYTHMCGSSNTKHVYAHMSFGQHKLYVHTYVV